MTNTYNLDMTEQQIRELSPAERNTLAELALGRILRMGARKSEWTA